MQATIAEGNQRIHLLTEENHVLFEQITLLRQHYDQYNKEFDSQVQDAKSKSKVFDNLNSQYNLVQKERDELWRAHQVLDSQLQEKSSYLGLIETQRKKD